MKVITYANKVTPALSLLLESAAFHDITVEVLGEGEHWTGLNLKLKAVYKYLLQNDRNEVYLFTDGYDSIFVNSIYLNFKPTGVLFTAERNCHPYPEVADKYPNVTDSPYKFINSGGWVAYGRDMIELLEDIGVMQCPNALDDQGAFTLYYLTTKNNFMMDHNCRIFQPMFNVPEDELVIKDGLIKNRTTGSFPSIVHGNGGSDFTFAKNYLLQKMRG